MNLKKLIFITLVLINSMFALNLPNNFSANFVQTINSNGKKIVYKGKVFFKNSKILWQYTYPNEKYIWINDKVYIYEPDLYQVTITKKPDLTLTKILKNAKKIGHNTYETEFKNTKVYFIYDGTLKKIWYKDEVGNLVTIVFKNQNNLKLDNDLFIPTYPKDVDIIYQK